MRRVLDELADAFSAARGNPCPRRATTSVELRDQFGLPITPSRWAALERQLGTALPPLKRRIDGLWSFPHGWTTVLDLAAFLADHRPSWQPLQVPDPAAWQEAQVFVGVRACLVEALNVSADDVVREARLEADLGAD